MVATVREHLEQQAEYAGTSIAELKATATGNVDPLLLLLKLSQSYLDSDEDPHDLTDLVANADGFLTADQVDLLDRMFGFFDLETFLRMRIDTFADTTGTGGGSANMQHSRDSYNSSGTCIQTNIAINNAGELSSRMIRSRVASDV